MLYNIINPSNVCELNYSVDEIEIENITHAIVVGQNKHSKGLFNIGISWLKNTYGGMDTIKEIISVDVHSGLGIFGDYSIIIDISQNSPPDSFLSIFGNHLQPLPYKITGFFEHGIKLAFRNDINIIGITQEFGTYPSNQILKSLIVENYHTHYNDIKSTHFSRIQLRDTFFPSDEEW